MNAQLDWQKQTARSMSNKISRCAPICQYFRIVCNIMRKPVLYLLFGLMMPGCEQQSRGRPEGQLLEHTNNEDQFTFLVFEKKSVENFYTRYSPIAFDNKILLKAIEDSLVPQSFEINKNQESKQSEYSRNTDILDSSLFNLSKTVFKVTLEDDPNNYFSASVEYLFFFECLPQKFKYKWSQTTLGHFELNVDFFNLLRTRSKSLDGLIVGKEGEWRDDMKLVFGNHIFNEITAAAAQKIKRTVESEDAFKQSRFLIDRKILLEFLDQVINNKWRLILLDWD